MIGLYQNARPVSVRLMRYMANPILIHIVIDKSYRRRINGEKVEITKREHYLLDRGEGNAIRPFEIKPDGSKIAANKPTTEILLRILGSYMRRHAGKKAESLEACER